MDRYPLRLMQSALVREIPPDALPVPITAQTSTYSCGTASVTAMLRYFQVYDGPEKPLRRPLGTTKEGTGPEDMVEFLRAAGLAAHYEEGCSLVRLLSGVSPYVVPIVAFQAWAPDETTDLGETCKFGHYAVVIGFDQAHCFFMDPALGGGAYGYLPVFELVRRWHDVGLDGACTERQVIWVRGSRPLREPLKAVKVTKVR